MARGSALNGAVGFVTGAAPMPLALVDRDTPGLDRVPATFADRRGRLATLPDDAGVALGWRFVGSHFDDFERTRPPPRSSARSSGVRPGW